MIDSIQNFSDSLAVEVQLTILYTSLETSTLDQMEKNPFVEQLFQEHSVFHKMNPIDIFH